MEVVLAGTLVDKTLGHGANKEGEAFGRVGGVGVAHVVITKKVNTKNRKMGGDDG